MAVKAGKRKWNPSHHPRDARGRFTRSSTKVLQPADRKRAAAGQAGFRPAQLGDAAARTEWLQRESAATPSVGGRIAEYLAGGWREDNPAMRAGKPVADVAALDEAFTPLSEDVMLRRIVPAAMFAHIPLDQLVGMKVRDAAPASASLDHEGPGHAGAVTMHIAAPVGTRAYVNDDAGEVLLMRDTEVAITRAVQRPDGNGWDLYGALIPRKDAEPRQAPKRDSDDDAPAVTSAAGTTTPDAGEPAEDETTAGGVGTGSGADGGDGGTTAPAAAPAADQAPIVLWKDAETGRPVYSPGQPEIVRKQVVRDPEREEKVRRGMAIAAAAMAGQPDPAEAAPAAGDTGAPEAPADSTAGDGADDTAGGAPTPVEPTRANWRDHGKPATAVYHGRGKKPDAAGRRVKIEQRGMGIGLTDAETGEQVDGLGITAKIWLAPDDQDRPAGDQDDQDAPAAATPAETPAAGTDAPSAQQDTPAAPAADDQAEPEPEDNGPMITGAPQDVIRAAIGSPRYHSIRAAGGALEDSLTPDEKRAVWDAMTGEPLDHDRYIAALGAPRYNGIYQDTVFPSTRDQDREAAMRAALARVLTDDEKAAIEATPATPIANPRDLSDAPEGSLAAGVAEGIRDRRALGGGNSGATVELVTLEDGRQAVRKRSAAGVSWLNPDREVTPKDQQDAEELGAAVAGAFGLRAPELVRVDDETSVMEYVPLPSGMERLTDADDKSGLLRDWAASDDGKRMGAADTAMGNPDRNAGNFMPDGDALVVLDHSLAFDYGGADPAEPWMDRVGRDWFAEHYVQRTGTGGYQWREGNPLTAADVAEIGRRLDALEPRFAELGREDWHAATKTRLAEMGKRAGGGRNLIATAAAGDADRTDAPELGAPETSAAGTSAPDGPTAGQDAGDWARGLTDADLVAAGSTNQTRAARAAVADEQDRRRKADETARGDAAQPSPRNDPAGFVATLGDYELAELMKRKGVLPRLKKAAAAEIARRAGDDQPAEQAPAATGPDADLPKTQAKALGILRQLGDGEHSEYEWRTAGAGIAAIGQLERKGYVTSVRRPFVMPTGPYAGETFQEWHYTLADADAARDADDVTPDAVADPDAGDVTPATTAAASDTDVRTGEAALTAAPIGLHRDSNPPLDDAQRDALGVYQDGSFKPGAKTSHTKVNLALRTEQVGDPDTDAAIAGIDAAMDASRLVADVQVWRGVRNRQAVFGDDDLTGMTWTEAAFVSTGPRESDAAEFAGQRAGGVLMRVRVPAGVGAVDMFDPSDPSEQELLLDRGHQFRVTADNGLDELGRRRLDVEVLPKVSTAGTDAPAAGDAPETPAAAEVPAPADGTAPGVPADLTAATPVDIDTQLADLYYAEGDLDKRVQSALKMVRTALGQRATRRRGVDEWPTSGAEAVATLRGKGDERLRGGLVASEVVAKYDAAVERLEANRAEQAPLHAEFSRRGGWTRFFEVSDGHIHRQQNCSTLHRGKDRTPLSWMLDMSGTDETKAIADLAEQAHVLCSVCIPGAPVVKPAEPPRRLTAEEQRARKAELERKARAEDPKLISDVDGEPLRVDGDTLRTVRSAEIKGVDQLWWGAFGMFVGPNPNEPYARQHEEGALKIARALAAKKGTTPGAELDTMIGKAVKKLRKDYDDKTVAARAEARWAELRASTPDLDTPVDPGFDLDDQDAPETPAAAVTPATPDVPETPAAGTTTPAGDPDTADLAAAVASGEREATALTGGANATVELVTYDNGATLVRKTPVPNDEDPTPAPQQADAEELAALVFRALGATTPRVLRTAEDQVVQDYMPGKAGADFTPDERTPFASTDAGRRLGLGDLLIANDDRHSRNWQVDDDGNVIGIDHALAFNFNQKIVDGDFVPEEADGAPTMPGGIFAAPFLVPYAERRRTGSDGWADHDFTPADMAVARERLAELQPRFAEAGRGDWHTMLMARFDQLAPHATGTRNLIADDDQAPAADPTPAAPAAGAGLVDPERIAAARLKYALLDPNEVSPEELARRLDPAGAPATPAPAGDGKKLVLKPRTAPAADAPKAPKPRKRKETPEERLAAARRKFAGLDPGPAETPEQAQQRLDAARAAATAGDQDTPAAGASAPDDAPAPIVAGSVNNATLTANNWGGTGQGSPVHYHPDGSIGRAVDMLGADARLDVDGLPLAEYLNRLATRGARVEITVQDQIDQLRALAARLPDGPGKRAVRMAAEDLDAPQSPMPAVPDGTPEPLARLMAQLWAVPMVRREGAEAPEVAGLNQVIARAARGPVNGKRLGDMVNAEVLNRRHESKEGKTQIDTAARAAARALEGMGRIEPAAAPAAAPAAPAGPDTLGTLPVDDQARIRIAVAEHAGKLARNPMLDGNPDDVARYLAEGELTKVTDKHGLRTVWAAVAQAIAADPEALTRTDADTAARREQRQTTAARLSSEAAAQTKAGDYGLALVTIAAGEQIDPDFRTSRGRDWAELRSLVTARREKDQAPAAGTSAPEPATAQPATSQDATPAPAPGAVQDIDVADMFGAMTQRVPKTVSRADAAASAAGAAGATEVDMFGNVTAFVPARRAAIGLGDRPELGRERQIAAAQQLGLIDETEAAGTMGAGDALFGLFDMPAADPPGPPPAPDTSEDDQRAALATRVLAEDLVGEWTDEQLNGAFADLTSGDDLTDDQAAAVRRIEAVWEGREAQMRALVAGIPEDLTTLDDDTAVALLVSLTSTPGTMDQAAVDRVNADLTRRETEATETARRSSELMARAYADPAGLTTEEAFNDVHEAALALGDLDQVNANLERWDAWEKEEAARAEVARQEAERAEAARMEQERIRREATAAREAAAAAEEERVRTERQMIAARAAAVIPPTEDSAVRSAHQALGEDETRRALGAAKYDEIAQRADNGPLQDPGARTYAIRAQLLSLDEDDKARLVMAAAEMQTPADVREMDDGELMMETLIGGVPNAGETAEQAEAREARQRWVNAEQNRRGMAKLLAEGREQFATYRNHILVAPLSELSEKELAAAPAIFADDPDVQLFGKLAEIRAEADRRRREADEKAAAKAAGPTGPARVVNPVAALGTAEMMLENYGRDFAYAREGQARLLSARALTVGLPADATEAEVKKAERGDERSFYERAAWTLAWYRHLGQFAELTDRERQLDWLTGVDDDPDAPEVELPLPGAKVPKPVEAWEAMKQQAIYDRKAGINTGAERYTMALARSYGIPFDPADRSEDAMRRLGTQNAEAMRHDPRTATQQAASFIAEWRRLAAEDGVDPTNALLYGPPDRRPKNVPRTQWTPTADEAIRVDRLVAGGMDYDQAYAEVMGIDPDEMRRAQAAMAVTGVMRPSDKLIRDHYAEFVYRQAQDAEAATNGYLLNKAGKAAGVDPDSLFSGDPDRAYRYASEELLRFWGEPGNERKTFSEYKAELVGDVGAAKRRRAASSKGNQFA